jgi:hypothetical protein
MSDRQTDHLLPGTAHQARVVSTARPEKGSTRGEGSLVLRALLLILGGIAIVSYVMMALADLDS